MATEAARRKAAGAFAEEWQGRGYEKSETQAFWLRLLQEVCGVEAPERIISFEKGVKLANAAFISHAAPNGGAASGACFMDAIIPSTHVLIEQKGRGHALLKPQKQSDGAMLTPFQQTRRYAFELPWSQRPRWIVADLMKLYQALMEGGSGGAWQK